MIAFLAFLTVVALVPLVCKLADHAGFVDRPTGRKQHDKPVPPLGGAVVFSVFLIFVMLVGSMPWAVLCALALILVVGIIDDAWEVNAKLKFVLHFLAAFILVVGGNAQIESLGDLLGGGTMQMGWFAIPFSVACVVYIQNAINMMDGVDGLAGGNSLLIFSWLAFAGLIAHQAAAQDDLHVLMACLTGFLAYNMRSPLIKSAKIFLGDAGSMALGLMIAWYAITLSQGENAVIRPVTVAWILALPIVDSFGLLITRLKERRPPFQPDRRHFHHHFANAGYSPLATTLCILSYSALLGAVGFFGIEWGVPEYILGWAWIALWIGHAYLTIKSDKFITLLVWLRMRFSDRTLRQSSE